MAGLDRLSRWVLVGGVVVWIANAVIRWWLAAPLGHDEARYALDARDWLAGEPSRFLYSGGGMTAVSVPGILLGASERALRFVPLVLGIGFLGAVYIAAKRVLGPVTAAWTVGVVAGSRWMTTHGAELLSDLPSAACLLLAIAILVDELARDDGPRWRIVATAPLLAAAFYLRYGSSVPIATLGGAFVLVGARTIVRRPLPVLATAALLALLLLPHALRSLAATGTVTGILHSSADIPLPSTGWAEYLERPLLLYGPLLAPLMLLALVAAPRSRSVVALQLAAVAHVVLLTFASHAQARFVYLPTVLLGAIGIDAICRAVHDTRERTRRIIVGVALAAVVAAWAMTFVRIPHYQRARHAAATTACSDAGRDDATRREWYCP